MYLNDSDSDSFNWSSSESIRRYISSSVIKLSYEWNYKTVTFKRIKLKVIYLLTMDHEERNCKKHEEEFHGFRSEIESALRTMATVSFK